MQHSGVIPKLCGAVVSHKSVVRHRREGVYKLPSVAIGPRLGVYNTTVQNAHVALSRRVMFKYNKSTDTYTERTVPSGDVLRCMEVIKRKLVRLTPMPVRCGLMDYPKLYTGGKRKVYERAVKSLLTNPLNSEDALVQAFVKLENTKIGADPRLIQSRSPRFHASLGCFIRPLEKALYRAIDHVFGEVTITKGLNGEQVGQLIADKFARFGKPVAIGLDASRFDRSVSKPMLQWVHSIYQGIYGRDRELRMMLDCLLDNHGVCFARDGKITYDVSGGVMSGDIDTSLKGCTIMCSMVWTWLRRVGVKASVVNNGDDCVVIMEEADRARFSEGMEEFFTELGFDIIAEEAVDEIERIEFCQARPVVCSNGLYVMCRNPRVATVKDSMCRIPIERKVDARNWMSAVASCGLALAGDMPIFANYYRMFEREAGLKSRSWVKQSGLFANGLYHLSKGMSIRDGVTDATRVSFWRAWGILPHEQRAIEEYYDGVNLSSDYMGPIENCAQDSFHTPPTYQVLADGEVQN